MRLALTDEFMMSYEESLEYLSSFSRQGAPISDLSRFTALADQLNAPQRDLNVVHIVGTNGKGSVTKYVSGALTACGYRTGSFTSPFIVDIRERITVDGEFISQLSFARLMGIVRAAVDRCDNKAFSQFEILTAICFLHFKEQEVDYCCIEAGIGGTLDCTNVIPVPRAAVFTSIGLDHTALLGNTEQDIARSKCGVVKGGTAVAAAGISLEAMAVIKERCAETGSVLVIPDKNALDVLESGLSGSKFIYKGEEYSVGMCGAHQIENCLTAIETLNAIEPMLPRDKIVEGLAKAVMPARLEQFKFNGKPVILDGGHNPQAMEAAKAVLIQDRRPKTAIIGMIDTKDHESALRTILPCFKRAIFIDGFAPNCVPAIQLAAFAQEQGMEQAWTSNDCTAALATAFDLAEDNGLIFVGGSLYMAAEMRKVLE